MTDAEKIAELEGKVALIERVLRALVEMEAVYRSRPMHSVMLEFGYEYDNQGSLRRRQG